VYDNTIASNQPFGIGNVCHIVRVLRYEMGAREWKPVDMALKSIATFQNPRNNRQVKCPRAELTGKTEFKSEAREEAASRDLQSAMVNDAGVAAYSATIPTKSFTDASKAVWEIVSFTT